jgi:hypothetical protein
MTYESSFSVHSHGITIITRHQNFFLFIGDGLGVIVGHSLYYSAKSLIDPNIKIRKELEIGTLLACSAFCSGFAWQPLVNALQGRFSATDLTMIYFSYLLSLLKVLNFHSLE